MMRPLSWTQAIVLAAVLSVWASSSYSDQSKDVYPGRSWEKIETPEAFGWSSSRLLEARNFSRKIGSTAVMIVQHGVVVDEWGEVAVKSPVYSVRKSFLSALIGIAVTNKQMDLSKTLADLSIDDNEPALTDVEKRATVGDLIKARSGVYHPALYETPEMTLSKPKRGSHLPGTFWHYNNWDFNALGTIYRQETGKTVFEAFKRYIADPLEMQDYETRDGEFVTGERSIQTKYKKLRDSPHELRSFEARLGKLATGRESIHPAYPIRATARDLARFGLLYLRKGRWKDRQVVPDWWVADSTISQSTIGPDRGYGYMWWTGSGSFRRLKVKGHSYFAAGNRRQYIFVFPSLDLIVVHRVNTDSSEADPSWPQIQRLLRLIFLAAGETGIGSDPSIEAASGERVAAAALRALLAGARLSITNSKGITSHSTVGADGTLIGAYGRNGEFTDKGEWWTKGRFVCRKWRKWRGGRTACFELVKDGVKIKTFDPTGTFILEMELAGSR